MNNDLPRQNINVDKENLIPLWTLKEGDNVILKLALFKNSVAFDITGQTIRLGAKTSKALKEQIDGFTIQANNLDIALKNTILIPGLIEIDLEFTDAVGKMTSASFYIDVNQKVLNDSAVEATNEFDTFTKTVGEINADYNSLKGGLLAADKVVYFQNEINKTNASLEQINDNFISDSEVQLGNNLITSSWSLGANWSGNTTTGFTHAVGSTAILENNINAVANKIYQIELTVEDTDLMNSGFKFNCTIGDSELFQMYQGVGSPITYRKGIKAVNNGTFKIIPTSDFTGTIKNISVREILSTIQASNVIKDENNEVTFETRPSKKELNNVFVGINNGQYNASGYENTCIGNNAMENSVSGFWNSTLGYRALQNNINGSRNIALGYNSLNANISGHRNIAVGTFALHRVTTGAYNIGIGADSGWYTTSGSYNIAIGTVSLDKNTIGSQNIAIGYNALRDNVDTSNNVAIGHHTLRVNKNHNNTAIGSMAMAEATGNGATAIGYQALHKSTGINNTAIGQQCGLALVGGNANVFIGRTTALNLTTGSDNTLIGQDSLRGMTEGSYNVAIGQGTGATLTKGNNNILIGENTDVPSAETSNHLNIGKLLYGDLANRCIGIGLATPLARVHIGAGTTTVPPMRINSGVLLTTPMNGAIEFDGTDLYITTGTGVRKKITSVAV